MDKNKTSWLLFLATILSPIVAFALVCLVGEVEIFSIAGIVRYSWIMWLFTPICILTIIIGYCWKKHKFKYKLNIISAFICFALLITFGSYRFIFNNISYSKSHISYIEKVIEIDFPDQIKVATVQDEEYSVSYLKFNNDNEMENFKNEVKTSQLWENKLSSKTKSLLPSIVQYEVESFDYFIFYNLTNKEYNVYPEEGEYVCVFCAFSSKSRRIIIISDFNVEVK